MMHKNIFFLLWATLWLLPLALRAQTETPKQYVMSIGKFQRLVVDGRIDVDCRQSADSAGIITFTATQEQADMLMINMSNKGVLKICDLDETEEMILPHLTVYTDTLLSADNGSTGILTIEPMPVQTILKLRLSDNGQLVARGMQADKLEVHMVTGCGKMKVDGECRELSARLLGTGRIDVRGVKAAEKVYCRVVGTGRIYCNADGVPLNVKGSGSGRVFYVGEPTGVRVRQFGSLSAHPLTPENMPD